jgi:urease accessory protein
MDDGFVLTATGQSAPNKPFNPSSIKRWEARLNLDFDVSRGRSYLAKRLHVGPLVLQKTLHPEGDAICHGVVIHPPGGVAGGDELTLNVTLAAHANVLLTTPGAGKWYKANGQFAKQHLQFDLQDSACFEWLPQENILFDGSQVKFSSTVHLAEKAKYAAWEIVCLGRQAQREEWISGLMQQKLTIWREGKLIWNERAFLNPANRTFKSIVGLNGNAVTASFVIAGGAVPDEVLEACRSIKPKFALDIDARYAVTALPEVFAARYIGQSSQCAKEYFEMLWQQMRPWYAEREAVRPRIWNT